MFYLKLNVYLNVYINIFLPIWIFINSVIHSSSGAFFWNSQLHQWWIKFVLSRICIVNIYFDFRSSDRSISFFFFLRKSYLRTCDRTSIFTRCPTHKLHPWRGLLQRRLRGPPGLCFSKKLCIVNCKIQKKKKLFTNGQCQLL